MERKELRQEQERGKEKKDKETVLLREKDIFKRHLVVLAFLALFADPSERLDCFFAVIVVSLSK